MEVLLIEDPSTILELKGSTALGFGSVPTTRVRLLHRLTLTMLEMEWRPAVNLLLQSIEANEREAASMAEFEYENTHFSIMLHRIVFI